MSYDVVIAGGGPAGLTAALILGRARKRVLLADAGTPRNAAAHRVQGFVTRDGTPPPEFRRIAREQIAAYPSVEVVEARILDLIGEPGRFEIDLGERTVAARRVLLCVGMIDELPDLPGYRELWGHAVFQCPYCHGWEVRDRAFGHLVPTSETLEFSLFLKGWSSDVVSFTDGAFPVPEETRARLAAAGIAIEERPLRALIAAEGGERLASVELADGTRVRRDVLFARPPQRQTDLVQRLGLALDGQGFVQIDEQMATSRPGVSAAGDLTTFQQSAQLAAAAGARAAYALNHALTMESAAAGS